MDQRCCDQAFWGWETTLQQNSRPKGEVRQKEIRSGGSSCNQKEKQEEKGCGDGWVRASQEEKEEEEETKDPVERLPSNRIEVIDGQSSLELAVIEAKSVGSGLKDRWS